LVKILVTKNVQNVGEGMIKNIFQGISADILEKRKKIKQPTFVKPMLATLTKNYFSDQHWMYEHKFDGERCLAIKKNGVVHLKSRNNRISNTEYPELVTALTKQKADNFIIDGEIVACNKKGISDFQLLQGRMHLQGIQEITEKKRTVPIKYCIFDIVYVDGYDITHLPLYARKKILKRLLSFNTTLEYTRELPGNALTLFKKACRLKWEGLIAKRREAIYAVGVRSPNWLKFKCSVGQELVIGGFTEPKGLRLHFGALLVGYFDKNKFTYAGKVGTGFTQEILAMLGKKLKKITTKTCPFVNYGETLRGVTWVRPVIVAEFEFAQWTKGGKLRVGRYKGLRDDKSAHKVVREAKS
jgi:bifunctional non-homologous end joining protein LigD